MEPLLKLWSWLQRGPCPETCPGLKGNDMFRKQFSDSGRWSVIKYAEVWKGGGWRGPWSKQIWSVLTSSTIPGGQHSGTWTREPQGLAAEGHS